MTWEQRTLLLDAAMPEPRWSAFFATLAKQPTQNWKSIPPEDALASDVRDVVLSR